MSHSNHGIPAPAPAVPTESAATTPNTRRGRTPLIHLPTWSRLEVATKQRLPTGRGGDFFELIQHRDGRVTTFMADVAGNGPSAAGPVPGLRWVIRQKLAGGEAPGTLLGILNEHMLHHRSTDERFVTALCIRVDPASGTTDIAGAGHLGPFVKRASGAAEMLPIVGGVALGMLADEVYETVSIELGPEDAIVLCTDGITDRMSTPADPLGAAGLLDHLERARAGAESICAALLGPNVPSAHDSTVVVLQLPRRHRRATPRPR
jgi:sigma-B regulation protein RsbU (phosphoserine phosphatase)